VPGDIEEACWLDAAYFYDLTYSSAFSFLQTSPDAPRSQTSTLWLAGFSMWWSLSQHGSPRQNLASVFSAPSHTSKCEILSSGVSILSYVLHPVDLMHLIQINALTLIGRIMEMIYFNLKMFKLSELKCNAPLYVYIHYCSSVVHLMNSRLTIAANCVRSTPNCTVCKENM
jgi:hypothetical protein